MKDSTSAKLLLPIFIVLSLLLISCSSNKEPVSSASKGELSDLPDWVIDPKIKDGVAGVGIAGPSRGGLSVQVPLAEVDAKGNIAATIQSEISRVTKNALRSAKVNENDDVEQFFAQATKEVVKNLPLSGARRINIFKAKDGSLYVRMMVDETDYSKFLKSSQRDIEQKLAKSSLGRDNINKSREATKDLFEELDRERGNVTPIKKESKEKSVSKAEKSEPQDSSED